MVFIHLQDCIYHKFVTSIYIIPFSVLDLRTYFYTYIQPLTRYFYPKQLRNEMHVKHKRTQESTSSNISTVRKIFQLQEISRNKVWYLFLWDHRAQKFS